MSQKPNILLIVTDDQRYNTIHALGNPDILTPNMDRLVREGTSFTHAFIQGGTSGAVCMPSRAMLHTGRELFHIDDIGQTVPECHTTIGECLRQNGYYAFGTGKWHNGPPAFTRSFDDGDNIFFGGMWDHWNVPMNRYDPGGEYDNVVNFVVNHPRNNVPQRINCDKISPGRHSSELITDTAVDFIKNGGDNSPFFLYTAYLAPHDPRTMPQQYQNLYPPESLPLPESFLPEHPFEYGVSGIRDETLAPYPRTETEIRRQLAEYYGMITHLDHEIGRLLDALEQKGELENTIVVLAGDNGLAMGCHGLMGKQSLYEHSVRVPLLLSGPGIPKNERREQMVFLLDIFPTLCELLGIANPPSVEGESFAPALKNPEAAGRERLYLAYCDLIRGVRDKRYKLISYRGTAERTQLFDLQKDPNETTDIYGQKGSQKIADSLYAELLRFRDHSGELEHPCGQKYWSTGS